MRVEELRIGNCVHFDMNNPREDNEPEQGYVDHIITAKDLNDKETIERLTPIPLTEEWLLKFGAKSNIDTVIKDFQLGDFSVTLIKDVFDFWIVDSIDASFSLEIKHVHQLQNLYFALTGEDLKLNN